MDQILNKKSGLLGISGVSSDDRDVTKAAAEGNERAKLAHEILEYQISKFIGGYMVALGGCDAIVFTAGVGENQSHHRQVVGDYLKFLGVKIDPQRNEEMVLGKEGLISTDDSPHQSVCHPHQRGAGHRAGHQGSGGKNVRNPVPSGVISKASGFCAGGFLGANFRQFVNFRP